MNTKLFGQFLLEKGYIGRDELLQALHEQRATNRTMGELAVAMGFLTLGDVDTIEFHQLCRDQRFGEVALSLGLLDEDQIEELVHRQRAERRLLGQILLAFGHLTEAALQEAIERHSAQRGRDDEALERALHRSECAAVAPVAASVLERVFHRVAGHRLGLWTVPMGRVIHDVHRVWSQAVRVDGQPYILAIQLDEDDARVVAGAVLGMDVKVLDDLAVDAVSEFLNIVTGHVCGNLSGAGVATSSRPPAPQTPAAFVAGADVSVALRCDSGHTSFTFVVARPVIEAEAVARSPAIRLPTSAPSA